MEQYPLHQKLAPEIPVKDYRSEGTILARDKVK